MTKYGYCRVATDSPKLNEQVQLLQDEMCDEIFMEVASGIGKKPALEELLAKAKEGDVLVITGIDRLSRNTKEAYEIINRLFKKGLRIQTLKEGFLEQGKLNFSPSVSDVFEFFNALEVMERNKLSERIKQGKLAAKERRYREQS